MNIREAFKKVEKNFFELFYKLYPDNKEKRLNGNTISESFYKKILLIAEEEEEIMKFTWRIFKSYGISKY